VKHEHASGTLWLTGEPYCVPLSARLWSVEEFLRPERTELDAFDSTFPKTLVKQFTQPFIVAL